MRTSGTDYYAAHDQQGSVMALTSASGATESLFTYNPFGDPRTTTNVDPSAPPMPLRFESQYLDPTGLYQLRARSMNPATGTFMSPDPLTPPDTSPAISAYLYASDQPSVLEDPSGESWWDPATWSPTTNLVVGSIPFVGDVVSGIQTVEAWGSAARTCGSNGFGSSSCSGSIGHALIQSGEFGAGLAIDVFTGGIVRTLLGAGLAAGEYFFSNVGTAYAPGLPGGSCLCGPEK
jgi:RHS repeat-associated protein